MFDIKNVMLSKFEIAGEVSIVFELKLIIEMVSRKELQKTIKKIIESAPYNLRGALFNH
jgi:hypothetical protein